MSIVLTGGAGFIGSCLLRSLNDAGRRDIIVVDHIASTEKWRNLSNKRYEEYVNRDEFLTRLPKLSGKISAVILPPSGILIFFIKTTLNFHRRFGSSALRNRLAFCMPAVPLPMGGANSASTMKWTSLNCAHSTPMDIPSSFLTCGHGNKLKNLHNTAASNFSTFMVPTNISKVLWQVSFSILSIRLWKLERWACLSLTEKAMPTDSNYAILSMSRTSARSYCLY